MRFKLEKCSSKRFIDSLVSVGLFTFALISKANATIYVSPANGGSVTGPVTSGGSLYFLGFPGAPPSPPVAPPAFVRFVPMNLTYYQETDPSRVTNIVRVNVSSNLAIRLTAPQQAVITFFSYPTSTTPHQAPIAEVNGIPCSQTSACVAQNWVNGIGSGVAPPSPPRYFGALYPGNGSTVTIGFYLADICRDSAPSATGAGGNSNLCTGAFLNPQTGVTGNKTWNFPLSFAIMVSDNANNTTVPGTQTLDSMPGFVSFLFQTTPPNFTCPDSVFLNKSYFPGDGRIFLDTTRFNLNPPSGGAPIGNLYTIGKFSPGTPTNGATFDSPNVNDLISFSPIGIANASVGGFQNATNSTSNAYNLTFLAQDQAGIYVPPSNTCAMGPVQTAAIQGFLPTDSKNCFIATAAFGSRDSAPVVMLREFRDRVLLKTSAGKSFVDWYYNWSPDAADWLTQHPVFRFPVLLLLSPLEVIAWLCLNPLWFALLLGSSGITGALMWILVQEKKEGKANEG